MTPAKESLFPWSIWLLIAAMPLIGLGIVCTTVFSTIASHSKIPALLGGSCFLFGGLGGIAQLLEDEDLHMLGMLLSITCLLGCFPAIAAQRSVLASVLVSGAVLLTPTGVWVWQMLRPGGTRGNHPQWWPALALLATALPVLVFLGAHYTQYPSVWRSAFDHRPALERGLLPETP